MKTSIKSLYRQLTLAITLLMITLSARADMLYGIDVPGNLFVIDLTTGMGTPIGTLPNGPYNNPDLPGYNEMEFNPNTGQAFTQQRNGNFQIQQFNLNNGSGIGAPVFNQGSWHALEFVGDTLYGAVFAGAFGPSTLATLNPFTGTFMTIGTISVIDGVITGLAYDTNAGIMYGINGGGDIISLSSLYTIDLMTGMASLIGMTSMSAGSLEFGPDGNLYAGGVDDFGGELHRINPLDGTSMLVGPTGFGGIGQGGGIGGLALGPDHLPNQVPAPLSLALFALGLLAMAHRSRKTAAK